MIPIEPKRQRVFRFLFLGSRDGIPYPPDMTQTEHDLLQSLLTLEETIRSMATANPKPSLLPMFSHIDDLTAQLPKTADPSLLHYLHKKSYEKARLHLQGRDAENQAGNCRHV